MNVVDQVGAWQIGIFGHLFWLEWVVRLNGFPPANAFPKSNNWKVRKGSTQDAAKQLIQNWTLWTDVTLSMSIIDMLDVRLCNLPINTPLKTNMSPENQWLEDVFPIKVVPFKGTFVSFQGCTFIKKLHPHVSSSIRFHLESPHQLTPEEDLPRCAAAVLLRWKCAHVVFQKCTFSC